MAEREVASIGMVIVGAIAITVGVLICPYLYQSDCRRTVAVTTYYHW